MTVYGMSDGCGDNDNNTTTRQDDGSLVIDEVGDFEMMQEVFFDSASLKRMLIHMCNSHKRDTDDPITLTVIAMLTSELCLILNDFGVKLFKSSMLPQIPYHMLNTNQKRYLMNILDNCPKSNLHISSHNNNGFQIRLKQAFCNKYLDRAVILDQLRECICDYNDNADLQTRTILYQILHQRIMCSVSQNSSGKVTSGKN